MACCWNLGVPLTECADALAKNHGVKGRMKTLGLDEMLSMRVLSPRIEPPLRSELGWAAFRDGF